MVKKKHVDGEMFLAASRFSSRNKTLSFNVFLFNVLFIQKKTEKHRGADIYAV